jgi:hypothetical protein
MNKLRIAYCILFLKMSLCLQAQTHFQNYIPNGSFDSIISTDFITYGDLSQHDNRWGIYLSGGTQFCHLSSIPQTIPNTSYGNQTPQKGNGMIMITFAGNKNFGCSEGQSYIQVKLNSKLRIGKKYMGRIHCNLADSFDFATSRIGMYISSNKPTPIYLQPNNQNPYIQAIPQIQPPFGSSVTDKINWVLVEDTFKATANMQYMTLGNFYRINNTDTFRVSNVPNVNGCFNEGAGYFLDNLSLVEEDRAEAYKDTSKNYLCVKQGTSKVLGDTTNRPWLQYTWRDKNNSIVGTNRKYTYNAALIENTFFSVEIKDTGEYAFITKAIDTIFIYTSVSPDTVNCAPVGLSEVLKDAEEIDMYYIPEVSGGSIVFNELHERFMVPSSASPSGTKGTWVVMKSIDGKEIYKSKLERKKYSYLVNTELQKGFYLIEVIYENNSIRRKKVVVQ